MFGIRMATTPIMMVAPITFAVATIDGPDPMTSPIQVVTEPKAGRVADAESQKGIRIITRARNIDDIRIVTGDVNHVRLRRNNADRVSLIYDLLLRSIDQCSRRPRAYAQPLDGIHHLGRLRKKGFPQLFGPSKI